MLEHWAIKPRYTMLLKMVSIFHEFVYLVAQSGPEILIKCRQRIHENNIFFAWTFDFFPVPVVLLNLKYFVISFHVKTVIFLKIIFFAGCREIVEVLVRAKANTDEKDANDYTPLNLASLHGHTGIGTKKQKFREIKILKKMIIFCFFP